MTTSQEPFISHLTHCHINSLPNELLGIISDHLSLEDLLHCSQVSTKWFNIVNEKLTRTESSCLVIDESSCDDFNSNGKDICGLILRDLNLCDRLSKDKLARLESFYLTCEETNRKDTLSLENLRKLLTHCSALKELTLKTSTPLAPSTIEQLLEITELKRLCLIIREVSESQRKQLLEFCSSFHHFYKEIVIEITNPKEEHELIYVCSDRTQLNRHVHGGYSKVHFGEVSHSLMESVLSNSSVSHVEVEVVGPSSANVLETLRGRSIEELCLKSLSSENAAWRELFTSLRDSKALKSLRLSHCSNITDEEIRQLATLHLTRLDIDFTSCPKISLLEDFVNYCLHHVENLTVCFEYDVKILDRFLTILNSSKTVVTKEMGLNVLRVNHCSEQVSNHLAECRSRLDKLASQCSMHIKVAEIFTHTSQS